MKTTTPFQRFSLLQSAMVVVRYQEQLHKPATEWANEWVRETPSSSSLWAPSALGAGHGLAVNLSTESVPPARPSVNQAHTPPATQWVRQRGHDAILHSPPPSLIHTRSSHRWRTTMDDGADKKLTRALARPVELLSSISARRHTLTGDNGYWRPFDILQYLHNIGKYQE